MHFNQYISVDTLQIIHNYVWLVTTMLDESNQEIHLAYRLIVCLKPSCCYIREEWLMSTSNKCFKSYQDAG